MLRGIARSNNAKSKGRPFERPSAFSPLYFGNCVYFESGGGFGEFGEFGVPAGLEPKVTLTVTSLLPITDTLAMPRPTPLARATTP